MQWAFVFLVEFGRPGRQGTRARQLGRRSKGTRRQRAPGSTGECVMLAEMIKALATGMAITAVSAVVIVSAIVLVYA